MGFAERNGFVKEKTVQVDEIDRSLRNRLYNREHIEKIGKRRWSSDSWSYENCV